MADVETAPGTWVTSRSWPVPGTRAQPFFLGAGTTGQPGTLTRLPRPGPRQSFVDDPARTAEELVAAETAADPNRLVYLTPPLQRDVRLSGTPQVTVRAGLDGRSPYLTALLVDYGTAERFAGLRTLDTLDCIGPGIPEDPGCFRQREYVTEETPFKIVSRGWLDVRNRYSAAHSLPIEPGRTYTTAWRLQPQDHVFAAGHRIGVVLVSTDRDFTLRYRAGTRVDVQLGLSHAVLPLG
jgi:X-Pro dipeptidyl-peptidase